jgi:hypothetical protein
MANWDQALNQVLNYILILVLSSYSINLRLLQNRALYQYKILTDREVLLAEQIRLSPAYPELARKWVPADWFRKPHNGKPVSACKDRWIEIKNQAGRICYAQWEDVGPSFADDASYVFGPDAVRSQARYALDVSPAVAKYLGVNKSDMTSWRFVEAADVQPGLWLRYHEQAVPLGASLAGQLHGSTDTPPGAPPRYELFLIDPRETVKTTITHDGNLERVEVTLSKSQASELLAFSQRNLGKRAIIGLLHLNKGGKGGIIQPTFINVTAPMRDRVLHFDIPNPHRALGPLIAQ